MKLPFVTVLVAASCSLFGCSSSPLEGLPANETGAGPSAVPAGSGGTNAGAGPSANAGAGVAGPTSTWAPYPAGPYGTSRGATIENLSFLGWSHPDLAGYEPSKFEVVRLSDFYDPDGHTGIKLLAINASAVWCSVCRAEYAEMNATQIYDTLRPLGVEILGALFEDNAFYPAQPQDLKNWGKLSAHSVKFPLVLDPGFKLGTYFDSDATPLNMLIDVRTMTIVQITMGYSASYWSQVQTLLKKL
jgi:AhpC/TSA family protein